MLVGLSLVIASAGVFNNYIDRDIDAAMSRTKNRALAKGEISIKTALSFAAILGLAGGLLLGLLTNFLTLSIALAGLFVYVVLYGFFKRRTVYGTHVGSVAGAAPPVVGYTAVSDQLDTGALILFLILVFWQMPHFYSIAIRRLDDYKAAKLPVLPVKKGVRQAKIQITIYILIFVIVALMLSVFDYTGYAFAAAVAFLGLYWLRLALQGFKTRDNKNWARQMFLFSLIVIITLSVVISANAWLP
jgi:protoheme IX farnesyltransferase